MAFSLGKFGRTLFSGALASVTFFAAKDYVDHKDELSDRDFLYDAVHTGYRIAYKPAAPVYTYTYRKGFFSNQANIGDSRTDIQVTSDDNNLKLSEITEMTDTTKITDNHFQVTHFKSNHDGTPATGSQTIITTAEEDRTQFVENSQTAIPAKRAYDTIARQIFKAAPEYSH